MDVLMEVSTLNRTHKETFQVSRLVVKCNLCILEEQE